MMLPVILSFTAALLLGFTAGCLFEWARPNGHSDTKDRLRLAYRELERRGLNRVRRSA